MILKKLLPRALAAGLATLAASSPAVLRADDADDAYNANDVLLFLQNPAGTVGTDQVVYFSLGSAVDVFRDAPQGTVTPLGNLNSQLTTTFGDDWTNKAATIFAGAAG